MDKKYLYEVLVPCNLNDGTPVRTKHHKEWDRQVREITGGLTIFTPARGQWVHDGDVYFDRVIPVRVACTPEQMENIANRVIVHYRQKAVMYYKVSKEVTFVEATEHQKEKYGI